MRMDSEASTIGFWGPGSEHLHQEHQAPGANCQLHWATSHTSRVSGARLTPLLLHLRVCPGAPSRWMVFAVTAKSLGSSLTHLCPQPSPLGRVSLYPLPPLEGATGPLLTAQSRLGLLCPAWTSPVLPPFCTHSVSLSHWNCKYSETVHKHQRKNRNMYTM